MGPERRKQAALKGIASRNPEQHREAIRKALAAKSPEDRKKAARKSAENRRRNREVAKGEP